MVADHDDCRELAAAFEGRLARLWSLILRQAFHDLSRTATWVLATLRDTGPRRVTELAASQAVAQPTMTTLLRRLAREGLVERQADPSDGRAVRVALTGEGRALLARMSRQRAATLGRRLEALEPEERAAIAAALPALDKLIAHEEAPK